MTIKRSSFVVFLLFLGAMPLCAQFTQWRGFDSNWKNPRNWSDGVPNSSRETRISLGSPANSDVYVPASDENNIATTDDFQVQSGGKVYFEQGAALVVNGPCKLQNDASISLGDGKITFGKSVTFFYGGVFDAGTGTIYFKGETWDGKSGCKFFPGKSIVVVSGHSAPVLTGDWYFHDIKFSQEGSSSTLKGNFFVKHKMVLEEGVTVTLASGNLTLGRSATLTLKEGSRLIIKGTFNNYGSVTGPGRIIVQPGEPALPVQLSSFTATRKDFTVSLVWSTQTETNNYGFEIERKAEDRRQIANSWQKVGFVAGSGTSTSARTYGYIDANLSSDRYAYRIKQIDNDGTSQYYGNAEVEVGLASREFKLESNYPNPFNPTTTIQFTLADDGRATLKVYNMIGQEVATLFDGEGQAGRIQQVKFDASRLPSGLYFAKLEAGKQQMLRKMMLVK